MVNRLRYMGMATVVLAAGIAGAFWLLLSSGGTTTPLSASEVAQRACDATSTGHFDATTVMTDSEHKILQTFTVAGDDSRLTSLVYTLDGTTLVGKMDLIWKDFVRYGRLSTEADPNTWGAWQILEGGPQTALKPPTPCLIPAASALDGGRSTSDERHFVSKTETLGETTNRHEFWADSDGLPARGLLTLSASAIDTSGAVGSDAGEEPGREVLRRIEITYSGFGQTNTITAPIAPPTPTPTPAATPTPTPTPTNAFSVAEDAAVGAAVGTVSATGLQGDSITYSITAGNGDGKFAIASGTGAITVAGALDHETTASYTLTVEASDGTGEDANKTTVQVTITVTNVDEPPVFAESSYSFSVSEDTSAFTIIGSVKATDPDAGDSVTHHLTAGDTSWWNIDLNEGFILVRKSLDYETKPSHTLTIEARDSGGSNRTSVTVDITITDVDES